MLLSFLTIELVDYPFLDIRGLVEDSNYQIAIYPGSNMEDIFKNSQDPVYQEAWIERIQPFLEDYLPYTDDWISVLNHKPEIALYNVGESTK